MNPWIWHACLVGSGGFFGAVCRYLISTSIAKRFPTTIPYGTLTVNLLGCFLLGILMRYHSADNWKLFAGTGFMGAFTTFSTLKVDSVKLLRAKELKAWLIYTLLSYTIGIGIAFLGYYI